MCTQTISIIARPAPVTVSITSPPSLDIKVIEAAILDAMVKAMSRPA